MKTYLDEVQNVLLEKDYKMHSYSLDILLRHIRKNRQLAANKVFTYKWLGFFLLLFIPLVSALLTILVSMQDSEISWLPRDAIIPLSVVLTILTVFNSSFKPGERFSEACGIGIGIDRLIADFVADLEKSQKLDDPTLVDLINKTRSELEQYQYEMIGMFMPNESVAQQAANGEKKKNNHKD